MRRQVLARIDTLPNASPAERRKIYTAVDRAREMSKIAIIHFDPGVTLPSAPEVEALIQSLSPSLEVQSTSSKTLPWF